MFFVRTVLLALLNVSAIARRWEDVIAVSIYAQSHVDIARLQFSLEDDPLSRVPAAHPTIIIEESMPPSDAPSAVPSAYRADIELERDAGQQQQQQQQPSNQAVCLEGESFYNFKRFDTQGEETLISIRQVGKIDDEGMEDERNYRGSLPTSSDTYSPFVLRSSMDGGDFDVQALCLSYSSCYEVRLQGGTWQDAMWEIVPFSLEAGTGSNELDVVAKGRGFANCTFPSTPDLSGTSHCQSTCHATALATTNSATQTDDSRGTGTSPNRGGFNRSPSTASPRAPSYAPSDFPSLVPTM
ncbi:expressed unknown protein [Seminavis robusta]|uniref:Uncharacterized protein n=1 Tax=Seminavis robusta TaxID=568900 RepID=A0A9N8EML6_9STRA|nr:expressed unknown protein [Seminavis robusta]|eukprot:Sro1421_g271190.1 n/a (298) ;mRNA; r:10054-10947